MLANNAEPLQNLRILNVFFLKYLTYFTVHGIPTIYTNALFFMVHDCTPLSMYQHHLFRVHDAEVIDNDH